MQNVHHSPFLKTYLFNRHNSKPNTTYRSKWMTACSFNKIVKWTL